MSKRITYLLSQFPETHETFITREILALKQCRWDISIISLKKCRDRIVHPESRELMTETWYATEHSVWRHLTAVIMTTLRHPGRLAGLLWLAGFRCLANIRRLPESIFAVFAGAALAGRIGSNVGTHIHAHWANVPATVGMSIAVLNDTKYSFTAHAWDIFLADPLLPVKVQKAAFVATCTAYNRDYLRSLVRSERDGLKVHLNYHGVDLVDIALREKPPENSVLVIMSIGRLVEQKGFTYLIQACALLKERGIAFSCTIIGDGPLRATLDEEIAACRLQEAVRLAGSRTFAEILDAFSRADVFALPCVVSRNGDRDGIPNVIIEAMALGVPVVSTDVSGVPELVHDGETGYTVPPRDAVALAARLEKISDEGVPGHIIINARGAVETDFDIRKNIRALETIFAEHIS